MVVAGLVLAGVGALVAGTAGPGEPSVADDEVAVPSADGARATGSGAAPPVVECRRAGGPFDCARWMRRPAGEADDGAFAWATATTDRVLVAHGSTLTALDRATGRMQWEHSVGVDLVDLRVDGEVVVAQTGHGTTFGLSIHDGTVRWTAEDTVRLLLARPTPGTTHTVRRQGDELVLTARNTGDGTARWRHRVAAPDPQRFPGLVHVVPSEIVTLVLQEGPSSELPTVVALDSEDGTERWRRSASHPVHASGDTTVLADVEPNPDAPDDPGLTPGTITTMVGLDSADGTERWRQEVDSLSGGHVFRDGLLVMSSGQGIVALDLATGEERWRDAGSGFERLVDVLPTGGPPSGELPVIVSFVDEDDFVSGRDPESGELVWRTQPVERAEFLTIVDGRIVAGQGGGSVTQLDPVTGRELVIVNTVPTGRPWFVADDVLIDAESGWVAAVDVPQPPSG